MQEACLSSGFKFIANKHLPNFAQLEQMQSDPKAPNMIICLEDLVHILSALSKTEQMNVSSFLTRSRHCKISIILVLHHYPTLQMNDYFATEFLRHSSILVFFKFSIDQKVLTSFGSSFFGKGRTNLLINAFKLSEKLSRIDNSLPYIVITTDPRNNLDTNFRIRLDLFKRNLICCNEDT